MLYQNRHYLVASIVIAVLTGCNTPQQRAHNTPAPIPPPQTQNPQSSNPPASGGQPTAQQAANQQPGSQPETATTTAQADEPAAAQNNCEAPSKPTTPDVEITDVPLDEQGNPIEPVASSGSQTKADDNDCRTAQSSSNAQQQNEASKQARQAAGNAPGSLAKAQTGAEKSAAANAQLDERLAAFDDLMRRARDAAAREREDGAGNPVGAAGGLGANRNMPDAERGAGGQADSASGLGHTPDRSGVSRPGDYQHTAQGPIPADLPDARDDDIVARQLREAATKEVDPVLREKLWDEYRRYKNGLVGR